MDEFDPQLHEEATRFAHALVVAFIDHDEEGATVLVENTDHVTALTACGVLAGYLAITYHERLGELRSLMTSAICGSSP